MDLPRCITQQLEIIEIIAQSSNGATENAGVENTIRIELQRQKTPAFSTPAFSAPPFKLPQLVMLISLQYRSSHLQA